MLVFWVGISGRWVEICNHDHKSGRPRSAIRDPLFLTADAGMVIPNGVLSYRMIAPDEIFGQKTVKIREYCARTR